MVQLSIRVFTGESSNTAAILKAVRVTRLTPFSHFSGMIPIHKRACFDESQSTLFPCRNDNNYWVKHGFLTGGITSILVPVVPDILDVVVILQHVQELCHVLDVVFVLQLLVVLRDHLHLG